MDVIASVLKLKGKVRICADGREDLSIPLSIYNKYPLAQGDILDLDEYMRKLAPLLYRLALDRAVKYLALRARSRKEVEVRLRQSGYPEETVQMAIFKLEKTGVLNDVDFARQWTDSRSEKGIGKRNIQMDLQRKGIARDTVEEVLADVDDEQQLKTARVLAEKWLPRYRNEDGRDAARKLMQALVRRGFSWDIARTAVGTIDEDDI